MSRSIAAAFAALLACLLVACSTATPRPSPAARVPVVLISVDGFRADDLTPERTPHLYRLARAGVRAQGMTPSYPSLTFPNHYTLVTGLRPDRHGLVQNTMRDPQLGRFSLHDREAVANAAWWGGEPIWVTAEKAGMPTATMFWPGSEAKIGGVQPQRWYEFSYDVPIDVRVDRVLGWLAEPEATRPRLVTLYFEQLDKTAHEYGPDSPQAQAALGTLDAAIGRLADTLRARGQLDAVNLVIVSDHGMAAVPPGQVVALEDMVPFEDAEPVTDGQSVGFAPRPGREAAAERRLLGRHAHYQCWRKHELPARWHYGRHPRVPAIVCQMDEGWDAKPREAIARRPNRTRGSHGYDPALPSMRALFVAHGPAFRRGAVLPAFDNVHVYPLLARLLGVREAPNDGSIAPLLPALADNG